MSEDRNGSRERMDSTGLFTPLELDTIGEIMNISMGSAATAASTLLDKKVVVAAPEVRVVPLEDMAISQYDPAIAVDIRYTEGISGSNLLVLRRQDVRAILSQMLMTELPDDFAVDEMAESAICELMNQMMGASATVLSAFLGRNIAISTPTVIPVEKLEEFKSSYFEGIQAVLSIEFDLEIEDVVETRFISAMHISLAREIVDVSLNFDKVQEAGEAAPAVSQAVPQTAPAYQGAAAQAAYGAEAASPPPPSAPPSGWMGDSVEQPVVVREYDYGDFGAKGTGDAGPTANLDLVMNVPVVVTVELGRTKRRIKEILEFGQGTIVELDKQAGSQVDVIVNGQLIAKGDVVVVDDNFSIRITEILKSRESLSQL